MANTAKKTASAYRNHPTLPIAIVGGGLGGLALAIGLVKHGVAVQIFEAAPAFSEIGAGVAFGINAIKALQLIDPRLLEGYKKHATFDADPARENSFYTLLWGMDERGGGMHKAGDYGYRLEDTWEPERARKLGFKTRSCIHRARLLDELVALLPAGITTFGKQFETARKLADGSLELQFADGTTALASAIVGCDGIRSRVRDLVVPQIQPRYVGQCAYRAVVSKADVEAALGADLAFNGHAYAGYDTYIISYPIENGELVNMVGVLHDWPHPEEKCKWAHSEWTVPATKEEFAKAFSGWYAPLAQLFEKHMIPAKWALFVVQHDEPYYKDRVCLLGDAAHATVPHLAAGAGMAMEDAYILSSLIAAAGSVGDIDRAFRAYDAVRRPRTQECIRRSLQAAPRLGIGTQESVDGLDVFKEMTGESFRWLGHGDLEKQLDVAKSLMNDQRP